MKERTLRTATGDPLIVLPSKFIILYKDQVLQGEDLFERISLAYSPFMDVIQNAAVMQNLDNVRIEIYRYAEFLPHSLPSINEYVYLLHVSGNLGGYNHIRYRLTCIPDFYSPGLAITQRVTRKWLFRKQVASKTWINRIKTLLVFKRYAVFLPDDILWKLMQPSLHNVKCNHLDM